MEILELAGALNARLVDITADSVTLEATAEDDTISTIVEILEPYGVISLMKTGTVALKK